jgi:hypothetical protein
MHSRAAVRSVGHRDETDYAGTVLTTNADPSYYLTKSIG